MTWAAAHKGLSGLFTILLMALLWKVSNRDLNLLYILQDPKLLPALEMRLPQCGAEQSRTIRSLARLWCLPDAPQDRGLLAARALLTRSRCATNQDPQVPFQGIALQHSVIWTERKCKKLRGLRKVIMAEDCH